MRVIRSARQLGGQLAAWRKLQGMTAEQVADRAGVSRDTLSRLENGDPGVRMSTFLGVLRAVGQLERVVEATDPYSTDLGRARAGEQLPQRVRR